MLHGNQTTVCLGCHSKKVTTQEGRTILPMTDSLLLADFQHGPVQSKDCTACHDVHGAQHDHLLKKDVTPSLTGTFDRKYYTLCFACHTEDLILQATTSTATQFRDGTKNLHFLHVQNRGRGNSCTTCHAVHGSNQGRHIARSIFYPGSEWKMRLEYTATPTGGTCLTDCHEEIPYSRDPQHGLLDPNGAKK